MSGQDPRLNRIGEISAALPEGYVLTDRYWRPVDPSKLNTSEDILGAGGSSIVLRAMFREKMRRALKVFIPRPDLMDALELEDFVESFTNEVERQAPLNFGALSKITDYSWIALSDARYPLLATEFLDGVDLRTYANSETEGGKLLKVLLDVLSALDYLHNQDLMHSDLKPENVVVTVDSRGEPTGTVVDLGSCKYLPADPGDSEDPLLYLYTSPRYTPSRLQLLVANRTKNRIRRSDLRKYFPYMDLHAFGAILNELLDNPATGRRLRSAVGFANGDGFKFIAQRLKDGRPGRLHYQSADEVAKDLRDLSVQSISPQGVPELRLALSRGVVIPGSPGRVAGTGRVERIISHPLFQRFNGLPQLDLLHWTLPGATNSRYVHAVHAYEIMRHAMSHLQNDWTFRIQLNRSQIEAGLYSALINQVGHYHFLHMFEDFISEREAQPVIRKAGLLSDDELLDSILGVRPSAIGTYLAGLKDERGRTFPDIVDSLGLDWRMARQIQRTPQSPAEGQIAALLSSSLDVEKLAYLKDDSVAAGLQFGQGLQGDPVFEAMVLPRDREWSEAGVTRIALGVREQAMSHLEYGVLARYWNIQTAYWNRTNRAVQSMVKFQIGTLIEAELLDFETFVTETLHLGWDGALRWINDNFRRAVMRSIIDPATVNPMEALLESRREIYFRLITISGNSPVAWRESDRSIFRRVQAQSPFDQSLIDQVIETLADVKPGLRVAPGEILIDLPRAARDERVGRILIYTDDSYEYLGELFSISANLQQHRQAFDQSVKRMRIYIHPRIHKILRDADLLKSAYDATLTALRQRFPS